MVTDKMMALDSLIPPVVTTPVRCVWTACAPSLKSTVSVRAEESGGLRLCSQSLSPPREGVRVGKAFGRNTGVRAHSQGLPWAGVQQSPHVLSSSPPTPSKEGLLAQFPDAEIENKRGQTACPTLPRR